jgi:tetratricopeptide (TPR) repeat protein
MRTTAIQISSTIPKSFLLGFLFIFSGCASAPSNPIDNEIHFYTKAVSLYPGDARGYYALGQAYWKKNDKERAVSYIREALRLDANLTVPSQMREYWDSNTLRVQSSGDAVVGVDAQLKSQQSIGGDVGASTQISTGTSNSIEDAKKKCVDLGFKPATEKFGQCVLRLSK